MIFVSVLSGGRKSHFLRNKCSSMKKNVYFKLLALLSFSVAFAVPDKPYKELVPAFNRQKSQVYIREIAVPTLANFDFAAYDCNPVLVDPPAQKPKKTPKQVGMEGLTFVGAIKVPVQNLAATPLTEQEKAQPLAWKPLIKRAWEIVKDDKLQYLASRVNSYKWADPLVFQPYQEVTTAYIHDNEGQVELWVKIEFLPWVTFVKNVSDEDGDGYREIYGKLNTESVNADSLAKMISWIKHDYTVTLLTWQQMEDWVTDLASYWYPTRNTDILDLASDGIWPDSRTGRKIIKQLKGVKVKHPLAVIEGKPFSPRVPIYNVFIVDTSTMERVRISEELPLVTEKNTFSDIVLSDNFRKNNRIFAEEVSRYGSYKKWEAANQPFYNALRAWLAIFPKDQMGLEGSDGWLFFRKSFDYLFGGDISLQPESTNPLQHIIAFKNYLSDRGVDLLFVTVPNKEEIYFDRISDTIPAPAVPIINPYSRKFVADLQEAGVEIIDLLPAFLEEKKHDSTTGTFLYQKQDTHWSGRGMEIAADLISTRITSYAWYKRYNDTVAYTIKDTTIMRQGDLAERLPQDRQLAYKPQQLSVKRVYNPDGTRYRGNHLAAPILLIGDSFTGVFELIDCKSAGIGSHIAARCRIPVDIITSWGGGPMVRQKMLRARGKYLERKQVVIYLMVARDLYHYSQGWDPLQTSEF